MKKTLQQLQDVVEAERILLDKAWGDARHCMARVNDHARNLAAALQELENRVKHKEGK